VGDYRVIYQVEASERRVIVVKIGHRKEVYR
jgi:mRNA-degrading endonuclease RelE of RelBE toxin-antitoxin system